MQYFFSSFFFVVKYDTYNDAVLSNMYKWSNLCSINNRIFPNKNVISNVKREEGNTEREIKEFNREQKKNDTKTL